MGSPRLFEHLKEEKKEGRQLFILDWDERYVCFFSFITRHWERGSMVSGDCHCLQLSFFLAKMSARYSMLTDFFPDPKAEERLNAFLATVSLLLFYIYNVWHWIIFIMSAYRCPVWWSSLILPLEYSSNHWWRVYKLSERDTLLQGILSSVFSQMISHRIGAAFSYPSSSRQFWLLVSHSVRSWHRIATNEILWMQRFISRSLSLYCIPSFLRRKACIEELQGRTMDEWL